jgi:enamine deaminase RidA (YjgF/YER057c/UK114 family)
MTMRLNPPALFSSPAFSQVVRVPAGADTVYVSGQNGVGSDGRLVSDDLAAQAKQAYANVVTCLEAAGAQLRDVVKWTIYVVQGSDMAAGFSAFASSWPEGAEPPAIAVAVVPALAVPGALCEIDAIAAIS